MKKVLSADLVERMDCINQNILTLRVLSERLSMLNSSYEGKDGVDDFDCYWAAMDEICSGLDQWPKELWADFGAISDFLREDIPLESVSEAG